MQKRITPLLGIAIGLFSANVIAASTIELSSEIVPRVINEQAIDNGFFESESKVELNSGHNQLLVTLGQIVVEDGRRVKYNSNPFILEFEAGQTPLALSYKPFRTVEDARAFEKKPAFTLTNAQGTAVSYQATLLHVGGLQGMKDYQAAVKKHNGHSPSATAQTANQTTTLSVPTSSSAKLDVIKAGFENMSAEEQKAFMMWAMGAMKK